MPSSLTAVILAGGASRRFGSDKASAMLRGRSMLAWVVAAASDACDRLVIVRAPGQEIPAVKASRPLVVLDDETPRQGPLAALAAAFAVVDAEACLAVSCDAPLLQPALVALLRARLREHDDAVVPRVAGFAQPLVAVYRPRACAGAFRAALDAGERSVLAGLRGMRTVEVSEVEIRTVDQELDSFRNANDPAALAEIEAILDRRGPFPPPSRWGGRG